MSTGKRIVLGLALLLIGVLAGGTLLLWLRPLAVFTWFERRALSRNGFSKNVLENATGHLIVWEAGQGQPVVFLHGAGDHAGAWAEVAPFLTKKYRVLILDLPGHGESTPTEGPLTIGALLAGIESLLGQRAAGQQVVLVGNSLGAWLAMLCAERHPGQVARIVAVNGGALRGHAIEGRRADVTLMPKNREEARRLVEAIRDPGSLRVPDFVLDDIIRQANQGPIARLAATASDMEQYLLEGRLQELTVPVELVWGSSDRLLPLDYARRMESQLPAVRLTEIPRCGHAPQRECPVSFRTTLEKLLEQPPPQGPTTSSETGAPTKGAVPHR